MAAINPEANLLQEETIVHSELHVVKLLPFLILVANPPL